MSVSRETSEFTIESEPLSVCSTRALMQALITTDLAAMRDAIRAELDTRKDWPPTPFERIAYGGLCIP